MKPRLISFLASGYCFIAITHTLTNEILEKLDYVFDEYYPLYAVIPAKSQY